VELSGRRAIVTGGSSGIGAATVAALRAGGARVAVLDLDVSSAAAEVTVACDVGDEAQLTAAIAQAVDELDGLDIVFANAGIGGSSPLLDLTTAEWDRVVDVNLRGVFVTIRESGKVLRDAGRGGCIVATASTSGLLAETGMAHYNVSKAGVVMLVRVAARELAPYGIRVCAVAPGPTDTPMLQRGLDTPGLREAMAGAAPLARLGTGDDMAAAVLALVQLDWVTGVTLPCDGGLVQVSPIDLRGLSRLSADGTAGAPVS
jgi:NAD(P)-dependent dehydrogenase (short-subunit alcohol dehydrogenase family)